MKRNGSKIADEIIKDMKKEEYYKELLKKKDKDKSKEEQNSIK